MFDVVYIQQTCNVTLKTEIMSNSKNIVQYRSISVIDDGVGFYSSCSFFADSSRWIW